MSRGNSVSNVVGYVLDGQSSILGRGREFSRCHYVQTGSGTHPNLLYIGHRR
jgi:hypothetical protein